MHEFILTLSPETFEAIEAKGIKHSLVIARVGKLFLILNACANGGLARDLRTNG